MATTVSIVLPSRNEARGLDLVLPRLREYYPDYEVVVVDDGSTDETAGLCETYGARRVEHSYGRGNGAAVKTGARNATGDVLVFMDADGQHRIEDVADLVEMYEQGYDMVVGARDSGSQASVGRLIGNTVYNKLASWMVEHRVEDLTSGFRAVNAEKFREFLHLLPNGFSYPATITMAFFRAGYAVGYLPIRADRREGKSHLRPVQDGIRFLLIIFRIATLYSPLKLFFPVACSFFGTGLSYYVYTYATTGRFTNMSALLFITAVLVFLIGLVSEQITILIYKTE